MTEHTGTATDEQFQKRILKRYLQGARDALVWKVEDLSEREARWPRVPSGNNLAGIVKHAANVEAGYFGLAFGREFPDPAELVSWEEADVDPQSDFYLTTDETLAGVIDLYRRVWAFADRTIDELPLDTPGEVPWWPDNSETTLFRLLVHTLQDLSRHAGHADILRETHDGAVGMLDRAPNLPDWAEGENEAYVARLKDIAGRY